MHTGSIPTRRARLRPWAAVGLATCLLAGCATPDSVAPDAAGSLVRSDEVIAEKIARKKAKLESGKGSRPQSPKDRYLEWHADRAGDDGLFTYDEVRLAKAQMEQIPELPSEGGMTDDAGVWDWEWLGPGNVGGRIRTIVIHPTNPQQMWIGSAGGGIWRTTNGGTSWSPVNDFLPSLAVSTMVMDPTNSLIMYAGTGEGFGNTDALPGAGVFKSTDGGNDWGEPLPDTVNWTVNRMAIDPTTGQNLIAAHTGGIHWSDDGGANWKRSDWSVSGNPILRAAFDVKFSPDDPSRAVAGLDGGDILFSDDGGQTWGNAPLTGDPGSSLVTLNTSPDNDPGNPDDDQLPVADADDFSPGDRINVGTGASLETVTVKGVTTQATSECVLPPCLVVTDMAFAHGLGNPVKSFPQGRVEVAYSPSSPWIIYASMDVGAGTIWKSTDDGATYNLVSNTTADYLKEQGWYDNVIWVAPNDSNLVIVGGIDLWRSTNAGTTLTRISNWARYHDPGDSPHADHHAIVAHPSYSASNRTVFVGNDGGIQKTGDILLAQTTFGWTNLANNLGITQFYGGAASTDGNWFLGGAQDNSVLRYTQSGGAQNWFQSFTGDGGYCAIDDDIPGAPIFYTETQYLCFKKSTDLGFSYNEAKLGLGDACDDQNARFIAPFSMDPDDPDRLVAGGSSVWVTSNGAGAWVASRGPQTGQGMVSAIDIAAGQVWVGYSGGQVSESSGFFGPWTDVDGNGPNPLPDRIVTDIAIDPADPQRVFVTFGNYEPDNVWFTNDGGSSWEPRAGTAPNELPTIHVSTVRIHPSNSNWVYVGTDLGVLASEDSGMTWSRTPRFEGNEGPVNTEVAELFWQGSYLIAATHGRGMYRTHPLDVVFVDGTNGGVEDGSQQNPWNTAQEGIDAAGNGATISIEAGIYDETGTTRFSKRGQVIATNGKVTIR